MVFCKSNSSFCQILTKRREQGDGGTEFHGGIHPASAEQIRVWGVLRHDPGATAEQLALSSLGRLADLIGGSAGGFSDD